MSKAERAVADVFFALGDGTRLSVVSRLGVSGALSATALADGAKVTRQAIVKHLRVLEGAGLVVTRRSGREKLHFLNPVPVRLIHDRWISKYAERHVSALAELKTELEESA